MKAVSPSDLVVTAGIAPNGERAGVGRTTPVQFLSSLLCLREAREEGLPRSAPL